MSDPNTESGTYFPPGSSQALACVAHIEDSMLELNFRQQRPPLRERVTGIQGRTITLGDGGQFTADAELPGNWEDELDATAQRWIRRAEKLHAKGILALAVVFIALLGLYRLFLPQVSDWVAMQVPDSLEQRVGERSYDSLIQTGVLKSSRLPSSDLQRLQDDFRTLLDATDTSVEPELAVHNSRLFGANALAFPGGPVVITDDLLKMLNDQQAIAVLAHELAHVEARHALKQTTRVGALGIGTMLLFGNDIGIVEEMSAAAIATYGLSLSRSMESEADAMAVEYLHQAGLPPATLIEALQVLHGRECRRSDEWQNCSQGPEWLSTHPSGQRRLQEVDRLIRFR